MAYEHLVRVGMLGQVGRFASAEAIRYPRRARVVLRTVRGLELGEVMAPPDEGLVGAADGTILRAMTVEDDLLLARLEQNRQEAFEACANLLAERGIVATLVDVEILFDGLSLFFYFMGSTPPEVEALTGELAEAYEARVQLHKFAETLTAGCGPGCGTEEATGQGCVSCTTCAISEACAPKRRK